MTTLRGQHDPDRDEPRRARTGSTGRSGRGGRASRAGAAEKASSDEGGRATRRAGRADQEKSASAGRAGSAGRTGRGDRGGRGDRADLAGQADSAGRASSARSTRSERATGVEAVGRPGRAERAGRGDLADQLDSVGRAGSARSTRTKRTAGAGGGDSGVRKTRADRTVRAERSGRADPGSRTGSGRRTRRSDRTSRSATTRADRPATRRPRARPTADTDERRAPTRGRYLARRWVAVLVVLTVVAVGYLVMFTSLLGVRSVEVIGTEEIPEAAVLKAAAIETGTPMVRLDADEAAARVAALPRVFEVVVERSWPSTVEILVTERSPVAVLMVGAEIHLVDRTGLDYAVVRTRPPGLPTLAMRDVRPDDPATRAAVTVLGAIPKQLKAQVTQVSAGTPGDVRLTLADGRTVKWGAADENARKAAVLAPLLTRPGRTYDVATPDFPTVAG